MDDLTLRDLGRAHGHPDPDPDEGYPDSLLTEYKARAEKTEAELADANEEIDRLAREVNRLYAEDTEAERKYTDLVAAIEPEREELREEFRRLSAEARSGRERQNPIPDARKSGGMVSGPAPDTQSVDQCQHSEVRTFRTYPPHTKCLACGRVVEQRWVTKGGE